MILWLKNIYFLYTQVYCLTIQRLFDLRKASLYHRPPDLLADGSPKREYLFGDKDTSLETACKKTFIPTLDHWEEELGKIFGVKDPPRKKTFWY